MLLAAAAYVVVFRFNTFSLAVQLEGEPEMLLEYENIHLFTFFDDYALITDLDNYTDIAHYAAHVNAQLLQCMHSGEYQLTRENYRSRWQEIADYYLTYDYDVLYS